MRDEARGDEFPPDLPVPQSALTPRLKLIGKAIRASEQEVAANPRARSAVLRIAERLH
jgi:16S rRNA (cytosine1402-N4)-methyltransferase